MFSGFFTLHTLTDEQRKSLLDDIYNKRTDYAIRILEKFTNINNSEFTDLTTKDTLLHLAVRTKNTSFIKYLLDRGINKDVTNVLSETPLDIAIKNQNVEIIKMLVHTNVDPEYKKLQEELETEKRNHKRKREDYDDLQFKTVILESENKKLKEENTKLTKDNEELKKTVRTLTDSMKKK